MYQDLRFYVDFNWEKHIDDSSSYFSEIYRIIELAYQHKVTVFYSHEQLQDFVTNCNELDESFSQSYGNKLDILLENAIGKHNGSYLFEICFSNESTSLNPIDNKAITVIDSYSKNALISVAEHCQSKKLLSIKSSTDFEKVEFIVIDNTDKLLQWIQKSIERNFNVSSKHGENGSGNWKGESVLLCNKYEAQQLLNTAIPDFCEKEKQIFNFDKNHETFIEFFYEGDNPQKKWHGFHIKPDEWEQRIPSSIRKHFNKL